MAEIIPLFSWYDYSFKDPTRPIPQEFYEKKYWPGAVTHNDGRYVHLGISDEKFTKQLDAQGLNAIEVFDGYAALTTIVVPAIILPNHHQRSCR